MPNLINGFWTSLDWDQWIYGLVAGFLGGGSGAVISGVVVSVNDPGHYNLASKNFYVLVASVFVANGLLNFFAYLHQNPLPKSRIVTTVETTKTGPPDTQTKVTVEKTEMVPATQTPPVVPPKGD